MPTADTKPTPPRWLALYFGLAALEAGWAGYAAYQNFISNSALPMRGFRFYPALTAGGMGLAALAALVLAGLTVAGHPRIAAQWNRFQVWLADREQSYWLRGVVWSLILFAGLALYMNAYLRLLLVLMFEWMPSFVSRISPMLWFGLVLGVQTLALLVWAAPPTGQTVRNNLRQTALAALVLAIALFGYRAASQQAGHGPTPAYSFYPSLAQAFTQGELHLEQPRTTKDITLYQGTYYVSFPPLVAIIMMPLVVRLGVPGIHTVLFNNWMAALGVMFMFLALEAITRRGWNQLRWWENAALAGLFGFGTAQFYMATTGIVVHLAQVAAAAFMAVSLWVILSNRSKSVGSFLWSSFFAAAALGLATLARPQTGAAGFLLAGIAYKHFSDQGIVSWRQMIAWGAAAVIPVLMVLRWTMWYNQARFGNPFDFGYEYMLVADVFKRDLAQYGQFNLHYAWQNFQANFLGLPHPDPGCGLVADPLGMSILITSPLLVYTYRSMRKELHLLAGWLSIGLIASVHLLYYNTGSLQFGYRFSMDFMAIALVLLAAAFGKKLPRPAWAAWAWSLAVGYVGVLYFAKQWCFTY